MTTTKPTTTKATTTRKPTTTLPPRRNPKTGLLKPFETYEVILNANNELHFPEDGFLDWAKAGAGIHKIDKAQALFYSTFFKANVLRTGVPITYALAAMGLESRFDADAYNKNLLGSNKENDPAKYDIGIAQLNLKYLIDPKVPERATLELARAFAHDPAQAVPYFFDQKKKLLDYARTLTFNLGVGADPRADNPYFIASTMYNMGRTGGYNAIQTNTVNGHANSVALLEVKFAKQLGEYPVMQEVLK